MVRVTTVFTGVQGSPWYNQLHFDRASTTTHQDAVDGVGAFWGAVDALMPSAVAWATEAETELVDEVTGDITDVVVTTPASGTGSDTLTTILPMAVQGVVRLRTGEFIGGREVRGRIFIPAITETNSTNGLLVASAQTTVNNAAAALLADVDTELVVWSRTHGVAHPVTSASVWSSFGVLTSRRD